MSYSGLQFQSTVIPIGAGMDQGTDEFVVEQPKLVDATNVRFDERGKLGKRYGHESVSVSNLPNPVSGAGEHNSIYDHDGKLGIWSPQGNYALDEYAGKWQPSNECAPRPSRILTDSLIRGNNTLLRSDIAIIGNLACVCWEDSTDGNCKYAFFDITENGTKKPRLLAGPKTLPTVTHSPRVIAIDSGTRFALVAANASVLLHLSTYAISAGTYAFSAPASLGHSLNSFDICTDGGANFHICGTSGADTTFVQCTNAGATGTTKTASGFHALGVMHNTVLDTIVAIGKDSGTASDLELARFAEDYSGAVTVSALVTGWTSFAPLRGTICQATAAGAMYAAVAGSVGGYQISLSTGYAVSTSGLLRGLELVGKAHYLGSSNSIASEIVVPLARRGQVQASLPTPPTADNPGASMSPIGYWCSPVTDASSVYTVAERGRFLVDRVHEDVETYHLSHTPAVSSGDVFLTCTAMTDAGSLSANLSPAQGFKRQIDLVRLRPYKAPPARTVTSQGSRQFASGSGLTNFDGSLMQDCTLPAPTIFVAAATQISSAPVTPVAFSGTGTYTGTPPVGSAPARLKVCYRWVDSAGKVHRSAPSGELYEFSIGDEGIAGGGSWNTGGTAVPYCFLPPFPSAPNGDRAISYEVEVYIADGTTGDAYYLIGIAKPAVYTTVPVYDYIQVFQWSGTGAAHQVFLPGNVETFASYPAAYFDTELHNGAAPPALDACSTQKRIWMLSAESRDEVWASKPLEPNRAPEMTPELVSRIPSEGGECVGIAALDDKVIVLKERNVYALFGDPGDETGGNSTLQPARLISGDVGCVNANSIVEGPFGVAFQSERGFYTLSRSLEFTFIGEPVKDALGDLVVTSGVLVPSQSEVRWTVDSDGRTWETNRALVYNYRLDAWSQFTGFNAIHSCLWRGVHTRLGAATAAVFAETPEEWEAGADEGMSVTTSWIKLAGLQAFKRVRLATFLGRWWTGPLKVSVGYDYFDAFDEEREWSEIELGSLVLADHRMQVRYAPETQKIESIRFRFEERTEPIGQGEPPSVGQGFELVGIQLDWGAKRGNVKTLRTLSSGGGM